MANEALVYDANMVTAELTGLREFSDGQLSTSEEITTWATQLIEKYTRHLPRRLLRFADLAPEVSRELTRG